MEREKLQEMKENVFFLCVYFCDHEEKLDSKLIKVNDMQQL